jgi:YVTN family beta-propeller protein
VLWTDYGLHRLTHRPFPRAVVLTATLIGSLLVFPAILAEAAALPSIAVGLDPYDVVVDGTNGNAYVTNQQSDTVSVINTATNQVVGTITVGADPTYLGTDPLNGDVYVANNNGADVSVIDDATNQVVDTIAVASAPSGVAVDTATGNIYVSQWGSGTVSVIDGATNKVSQTITVGGEAFAPAFDPANGDIYVPCWSADAVYVIDGTTNQVIQTISVGSGSPGSGPNYATVDVANGDVYIANWISGTVSVINGATNTVVATIGVGTNPRAIAVDSSNGNLYVTNNGDNTVSVINGATNQVTQTINVGSSPEGIAADPLNGSVYVVDSGSNAVSVISPPPAPVSWTPPTLIPESVTVSGVTGQVIGNLGYNPVSAIQYGTSMGYTEERAAVMAGASFTGEGIDSSYLSAILDGSGVGLQQHVSATEQGQFAALYQSLGIIPTWTDNTVSISQGVKALIHAGASTLAIENYLVQLDGFSWTAAEAQAQAGFPIQGP